MLENARNEAQTKKIAITGGAGFVGTNLARALVSSGHKVQVIDDLSTGLESNLDGLELEFHKVSILDFASLKEILEGVDVVFHLAALGSVPRSLKNPRASFQTNALGTLNVLECAKTFGSHIVFSSSSSVYGANLKLPKSEDMLPMPLSPYAASKLAGESLIQSYAKSFNTKATTFRFFNIFGSFQRHDHDYAAVIPKWIWSAMNDQPLILYGNGEQTRDFTSVDDVVSILINTLNRNIVHPTPVNLAFGNRYSLNYVIELLRTHFPKLQISRLPERKGDVVDSQNNPNYLFELFPDYSPKSFDIAFNQTIDWFKKIKSETPNSPKTLG
jgi:UDP-glucose 4-epimerase